MRKARLQLFQPDGFTLAEMLIAIFIFSAVVGMTYGAYNMTFKVIKNANTNSKYGERARIAMDRITDDLESVFLGRDGVFQGETNTFGEYRGDNLTFTSTAHLVFHKAELPKGLTSLSYTVEEDEGQGTLRLYRSDVPLLPGAVTQEEKGFLLCDELREFALYYGDEDGNESDAWSSSKSSFSSSSGLPATVRIKLGFVSEENEEETVYYSTSVALPALH